MTHEEEARAALPGCHQVDATRMFPDTRHIHNDRGLTLFVPEGADGWVARYWGGIGATDAESTTSELALANLRAKLTGDDLRRAFPDDIATKARALQAFLEAQKPDMDGVRRADIDEHGIQPTFAIFDGNRSAVRIGNSGCRYNAYTSVNESPTARAVITEWIRQGSEPTTKQDTMTPKEKARALREFLKTDAAISGPCRSAELDEHGNPSRFGFGGVAWVIEYPHGEREIREVGDDMPPLIAEIAREWFQPEPTPGDVFARAAELLREAVPSAKNGTNGNMAWLRSGGIGASCEANVWDHSTIHEAIHRAHTFAMMVAGAEMANGRGANFRPSAIRNQLRAEFGGAE